MRRKNKKIRLVAGILIWAILIFTMVLLDTKQDIMAASATSTVTLNITYGQTDARKMLESINAFRKSSDAWYWNSDNTTKTICSNLQALSYDYELEKIAMQRAAEIAIMFSHTRPNGKLCFSCCFSNYKSSAENIAAGKSTYQGTFEQLQENSEKYSGQGHRRAMLSSGYTAIGIAHVNYNGIDYWVQEFGTTKSNTSACSAVDTEKAVEIELSDSNVKTLTRKNNVPVVSVVKGKTINVPDNIYNLVTTEVWPYDYARQVTINNIWSVSDTSIASVTGKFIKGIKVGKTKLTTTVAGKTFAVELNVLDKECVSHVYNTGKITLTPTCEQAGEKTFTCTKCGHSYVSTIAATGHDWSGTPKAYSGQEPTCTTVGKGRKDCANPVCVRDSCMHYYMDVIIPATGHKEKITTNALGATCTKAGRTKGSYCEICNKVISTSTFIPALGHSIKTTYTWTGNASACTMNEKCQRNGCAESRDTQLVVALDSKVASTCSTQGYKKYVAKKNGSNAVLSTKTITLARNPNAHRIVKVEAVAATCTATGLTEGKKCDACGATIIAQKVTNKLTHTYNKKVVNSKTLKAAATTTSPAIYYYSCSCGAIGSDTFTKGDKLPTKHNNVTVNYHTHIQSFGDSQGVKKNGEVAGTSGMAKRLENIWIKVEGNENLGIKYTTHCQSYGWMVWSANGEQNGTSGEGKRLEAIKIELTGSEKSYYDVYYRVHAQSYGWLAWAKNGEPSGTAGYARRLEGIQIVVKRKGEAAPGLNYCGVNAASGVHNASAYITKTPNETAIIPGNASASNIVYKTHVQSFGWQNWVSNGDMSGTSGRAKRLEGISIKLSNCDYSGGIEYWTHVQTYGWSQGWKANGAISGTSGQAKRLEAIRIRLTGEMAKHYDVYYRVHAQSFGWLNWAKNGQDSGTSKLAKRLEGIQIVLVPKGKAGPGKTYAGITATRFESFISR